MFPPLGQQALDTIQAAAETAAAVAAREEARAAGTLAATIVADQCAAVKLQELTAGGTGARQQEARCSPMAGAVRWLRQQATQLRHSQAYLILKRPVCLAWRAARPLNQVQCPEQVAWGARVLLWGDGPERILPLQLQGQLGGAPVQATPSVASDGGSAEAATPPVPPRLQGRVGLCWGGVAPQVVPAVSALPAPAARVAVTG